jgi:hypothetical protein
LKFGGNKNLTALREVFNFQNFKTYKSILKTAPLMAPREHSASALEA